MSLHRARKRQGFPQELQVTYLIGKNQNHCSIQIGTFSLGQAAMRFDDGTIGRIRIHEA